MIFLRLLTRDTKMKTFLKLAFIACCLAQFTPAIANFQSHITQQVSYVPLECLHFSEEGIFLNCNPGSWTRIEQLGCDSRGYFVSVGMFRQRHYIAKCNNCGEEYQNRCPQPCEGCNESKGLELVYIEDGPWD